MLNKIWYMAVVLGVVGFAAGLGLAGVKQVTDPIIEQFIIEEGIKPSLDKFFSPAGIECDVATDKIKIELGVDERGRKQRLTVFKGKKGDSVAGAALQTTVAGFGGNVEVLTLIDVAGKKILGAKCLSQSETPGLGARIANDEEPFIKQFVGLDYSSGVKLKADGGEVDAISGATISSRAFCKAVDRAVELSSEHADKIESP